MSITLTGVKSDVVILAAKLTKAIKDETGIVLKLSDDNYGQKLDNIMQIINTPSTVKAYKKLTGKALIKQPYATEYSADKNTSTIELIKSNLHQMKLSSIFNQKSES